MNGLYLIIDIDVCRKAGNDPLEVARCAAVHKVPLVQLRWKNCASLNDYEQMAKSMRHVLSNNIFIINDYSHLVCTTNADGLHIGPNDISVWDARATIGSKKLLGFSAKDCLTVSKDILNTTDYIGVGCIFQSPTKTQAPVLTDGLEGVMRKLKDMEYTGSVYAIGGLTDLGKVVYVMDAGCHGIVVLSYVCGHTDPGGQIAKLQETIRNFQARPKLTDVVS